MATTLISTAWCGDQVYLRNETLTADAKIAPPNKSDQTPRTWIVQLKTHAKPPALPISAYLPDDAWIVHATAAQVMEATDPKEVSQIRELNPQWKLSPMNGTNRSGQHEWLISIATGADSQIVTEQIQKITGTKPQENGQDHLQVQTRLGKIAEIAKIPAVLWIQPLPKIDTMDFKLGDSQGGAKTHQDPPALTGYESGTKIMRFDAAWERGYAGKGSYIGVYDTGIDQGQYDNLHWDLIYNTYWGYRFVPGSWTWEDRHAHGTHVTGSIIGDGHESKRVIRGGAWQANAHAAKLVTINNYFLFKADFDWLYGTLYDEARVKLFNNSWGMSDFVAEYDTYAARIDTFISKHPEAVIVFAAGNSGMDTNADGRVDDGSIGPPATAKNVISVGASENYLLEGGWQTPLSGLREELAKRWPAEPLKSDRLSNNANGIAAFSSRGPCKDGRIKPDIVAPGTNIVSVRSQFKTAGTLWGVYNKDYLYSGGTSMAAPLITAAAAVTREYLKKGRGFETPTAALIKAVLLHTATDLFPGQYGTGPTQEILTPRPNNAEGFGLANMDAATNLPQNAVIVDETLGLATGEQKQWEINRTQAAPFRATLVYTDAPATPLAARALVNDLDLEVVLPDGSTKALNDRLNNVEMIEIASVQAGTVSVRVKGTNVPQGVNGKQSFALLVTH